MHSQYVTLERALERFAHCKHLSSGGKLKINVGNFTESLRTEFEIFLTDESKVFALYPEIFADPEDPKKLLYIPQRRGRNTMVGIMKKFDGFLKWCVEKGYNKGNDDFPTQISREKKSELYGDPYYLSLDEVERIYRCDFSAKKTLERQRDIFVFQCLVGCRVSDLVTLTKDNVQDGVLSYVAKKTVKDNVSTIGLPLSPRAMEIIEKYNDVDPKGRLLPFISDQKYNVAIKDILRIAGIDRMITTLDPKTQTPQQSPIWAKASSHLARRTFIGNAYKETQDPNLIGSMTGHVEGSKAFARYRSIDMEIKSNLMKKVWG